MTIKQQGGVFGRNPSFNDVDVQDLTAASVDINGGTIDGTAIGGSTPAAIAGTTGRFGDLLKVNVGTEPDVVPPAGTAAVFQRNTFTYSGVSVGLLAGVNGPCVINFGDTADQDIGSINYNCALNTMAFTANTTLGFTLTSSGNIAFPSGQGIDFSATSGTGTSELFDDYEEGTFTVTTAGDATGAFTAETGEYTKIGNVVYVRIALLISANFTSNKVGGLPFTPVIDAGATALASMGVALTQSTGSAPIIASYRNGQTDLEMYTSGSQGAAHLLNTTNSYYRFQGFYFV